jgi:archaetidylserine synthase
MKIFKKIFNHEIWGFNKMHLKYIALPDLISLINASLGFLAIIMAARGDLALAAKFILLAVIFDFLDGWVARKTKRVDQVGFGKNIDSLSDVISFGVAPGILLYSASTSYSIPYINILVSLLVVLCGIIRLSRFNVLSNSAPSLSRDKFIGLPIPSTALILGSLYLSNIFNITFSLAIMGVASILMVSNFEYPKIKNPILLLVGGLLIILTCLPQSISSVIFNLPANFLFILTLLYLIMVPFMHLYANFRRSGRKC